MKKLISLGISIVMLVSAFVLLPKQKHEDVIAGPAGGEDQTVESLYELKNSLMALVGYDDSVKSGTIKFSYSQDQTTGQSSYEGGEPTPDIDYNPGSGETELTPEESDTSSEETEPMPDAESSTPEVYQSGDTSVDNSGSDSSVDESVDTGNESNPDAPSLPIDPNDPGAEIDPGELEDQIKDEYQEEIENEVNNNIGNVLDNLSIGLSTQNIDLTLYFDGSVIYYSIQGTFATRMGEGENKKVLSYVYDIEIYYDAKDASTLEDDVRLVRFNFFDGYSHDPDVTPLITADKLGVWYKMDYAAIRYVHLLIFDFSNILYQVIGAQPSDFETFSESDNVYSTDRSDENGNHGFTINLCNNTRPSFSSYWHTSNNDYINGQTKSVDGGVECTLYNIGNTKVEFDLSKVDVKEANEFDWSFFAQLFMIDAEEGGLY